MFIVNQKYNVKLSASISVKGRNEIDTLLLENYNIRLTTENYSGLELKNKKGRLTKRLSKSIKKEFGVKLAPSEVSEIGNIAYNNTLSGDYSFTISHDLDVWEGSTISNNDGSCFRVGGQYHYCWVAMDDDHDYYAVRICRDGKLIARSWLKASNNNLALFNVYGMTLDKLSLIVGKGLNHPVKKAIYNHSNLFINSDRVNLIGTGDYDLNPYCEGMHSCDICGDGVLHEDETCYADDMILCEDCYSDNYSYCETCGESHSYANGSIVGEQFFCEDCYSDNYSYCDNCDCEVPNECLQVGDLCEDCWLELNRLCVVCDDHELTEDGTIINNAFYCYSCRDDYTACETCGQATDNNNLKNDICGDCND